MKFFYFCDKNFLFTKSLGGFFYYNKFRLGTTFGAVIYLFNIVCGFKLTFLKSKKESLCD